VTRAIRQRAVGALRYRAGLIEEGVSETLVSMMPSGS
jgi:hypothetical protein